MGGWSWAEYEDTPDSVKAVLMDLLDEHLGEALTLGRCPWLK
jgi:hypothetical protein